MTTEIIHQGILVQSEDEESSEAIAIELAKVFSQNWVEDFDQNEPIAIHMVNKDGSETVYIAKIITVN